MNIDNVKVGDKFPTVNKLVISLGLQTAKGKQRILQDNEISRYLNYKKTGKISRGKVTNEIIITEIFDEPKEKIDGRGQNISNTKYDFLMDDIIIDRLLKKSEIVFSFMDMFTKCIPLLTEDYIDGKKYGFKYISDKYDISIGLVTTYSNKIKDMIKGSFETALNRLQRKGLLTWANRYIVLNLNNSKSEFASKQQEEEIKKAEKQTYLELEMKPYERINQNMNDKFRRYVLTLLDDKIYNYWKVYHVKANENIKNIKITKPDLKELTTRYVMSIDTKIKCHTIKDKKGNKFYPYMALKHTIDTSRLHLLFWNQFTVNKGFNLQEVELQIIFNLMDK